jgi:hypothetical protein
MHKLLIEGHEKRTEKLTDLWACAHEYRGQTKEENLELALRSLINIIAGREEFGYQFIKDMTALANSNIAERVVEQRKTAS